MAHPLFSLESFAASAPISSGRDLPGTRKSVDFIWSDPEVCRKVLVDGRRPPGVGRNSSAERHQSPSRKVSFREGDPETAANRPSLGFDTPPDQLSEAGQPLLPSSSA
jgi:hypothetical protein